MLPCLSLKSQLPVLYFLCFGVAFYSPQRRWRLCLKFERGGILLNWNHQWQGFMEWHVEYQSHKFGFVLRSHSSISGMAVPFRFTKDSGVSDTKSCRPTTAALSYRGPYERLWECLVIGSTSSQHGSWDWSAEVILENNGNTRRWRNHVPWFSIPLSDPMSDQSPHAKSFPRFKKKKRYDNNIINNNKSYFQQIRT